MLIRVIHSINPCTSVLEELVRLFINMRHICTLLNRSPVSNPINPLLESRKLKQVNLQQCRTTANPRIAGDIGNCVL